MKVLVYYYKDVKKDEFPIYTMKGKEMVTFGGFNFYVNDLVTIENKNTKYVVEER